MEFWTANFPGHYLTFAGTAIQDGWTSTTACSRKPCDQVSPLIIAAIALLLLAVTTLAAWTHARHASRIDPMGALRDE
jgi:ABC-type lipoprotein release transport system permease subunit